MIAASRPLVGTQSGFECVLCEAVDEPVGLGPNADFVLAEGEVARVVRCPRCSLVGTHPLPGVEELAEAYREAYRRRRREGPDAQYLRESDNRAAAQWAFLRGRSRASGELSAGTRWDSAHVRILDVGCAAGSFLFAAKDRCTSLTGFEPDRSMWEAAGRRLPRSKLLNSVFQPSRIAGSRFDLIAASHVLEHVPDPVGFLRGLLEALETRGVLFLEVPNEDAETISALAAGPAGRMHLYFFDPKRLTAVVEAAGGSVVAVGTFGELKVGPVSSGPERGVGHGWISKMRRSAHPAAGVVRATLRAWRGQRRRRRMFVERGDGDCLRVIATRGGACAARI